MGSKAQGPGTNNSDTKYLQSGLLLLKLGSSLLHLQLQALDCIDQQVSRPPGLVWSNCSLLQVDALRRTLFRLAVCGTLNLHTQQYNEMTGKRMGQETAHLNVNLLLGSTAAFSVLKPSDAHSLDKLGRWHFIKHAKKASIKRSSPASCPQTQTHSF